MISLKFSSNIVHVSQQTGCMQSLLVVIPPYMRHTETLHQMTLHGAGVKLKISNPSVAQDCRESYFGHF